MRYRHRKEEHKLTQALFPQNRPPSPTGRAWALLAIGFLAVALQVSCGKGVSDTPAKPSTGNAALDTALAMEVDLEGSFSVEPASQSFRANVPLSPTLTVDEGVEKIGMQLPGAGGEISCFVYESESDIGGSALRLSRSVVEVIEQNVGEFPLKKINGFYVGAAGGMPYHGVEWLLGSKNGSAQPKVIAANKHGRGLACLHSGLGFEQTFERIFRGFLESFSVQSPPPAPYYSEVIVSKLGDLPVGVESVHLTLDGDGDTEIRTFTSLIIPVDAQEVSATISTGRSWSRPDGSLINAHVSESDENEEHTNLGLIWSDDEGWGVSGMFQGKELESTLAHTGPIHSRLMDFIIMTRVLKPFGDQEVAETTEWVTDIDPTDVIPSKISISAQAPYQARVEAAGVSFEITRGQDGLLKSATIPIGSSVLKMNLVHREGQIPK